MSGKTKAEETMQGWKDQIGPLMDVLSEMASLSGYEVVTVFRYTGPDASVEKDAHFIYGTDPDPRAAAIVLTDIAERVMSQGGAKPGALQELKGRL